MILVTAVKHVPVNWSVTTVGDGLWEAREGVAVNITSVGLIINAYPENDGWHFYGEARVYHDLDAQGNGLLYTDSVEDEIERLILEHPFLSKYVTSAGGSEQGMQDRFMLSLDVEQPEGITLGAFMEDGFEVETVDLK